LKKWLCTVCGYIYDPAQGDPEHGIPAGTPFESISDDWVCPICGVGREMFEEVIDEVANPTDENAAAGKGKTNEIVIGQKDTGLIKSAIFKLSYGLFVVTSIKGEKINGQTANTVFQITSEPMTVALGINKSNLTHEYIMDSGLVGITILGQDNHDLVRRFGYSSGRDKNKFEGVDYVEGTTGVPIVKGGIAFLEAKVLLEKRVDVGTHTLFVAEVIDGAIIEDSEPMTYAYFRKTK